MRMPKGFNKWTLQQQEEFFIKKLNELYDIEKEIKQTLAKIRGGNRMEYKEIERPDEILLKDL
jgi:ferritin-like metal-binding protein YciE